MFKNLHSLLFILLFACLSTANAKIITVTSASTISSANPAAGDTLLMSKTANWANQNITFSYNGTAAKPITLLAEGNGEVILSGSSSLIIGGTYLIVSGISFHDCVSTEGNDLVEFQGSKEASFCRLTNCSFKNNNPTDLNIGYKWVSLHGDNNRVDHCWFQEKKHRGTTLVVWLDLGDAPNYHRIDHNYFTRPLLSTGNNEAETIRVGDSNTSLTDSRTTVEYNFFEECDGEIEVISNKSCYNVYQYNTFYNNAAILTLRHGHYCTVKGNYFFGNGKSGSGGVRIIGVGHKVYNNYMQDLAGTGNLRAPIVIMGGVDGLTVTDATNRYVASQDNLIAFNTIVNCAQNIYVGSDKTSSPEVYKAPSNNTIDNNIIYNGKDAVMKYEFGEIASFKYSGNMYFNTTLGTTNSGFTNVDPLFTTATGFVPYRIKSNSPAINASTGTYTYTEDFDGETRIGKLDVGCDEYMASSPLRNPILKTEVGPCWLSSGACGTPIASTDCKGVVNGTATIDNCGICSGGTTGILANSTCTFDCSGVINGTATIDKCGVCSGGSTTVAVDECLRCVPVKTTSDDGNVGANVLDNDLITRWSAQGAGQTIEFCLGETAIPINQVSIAFYKGNERTTTFDLEVSTDGLTWTKVITNKTSAGLSLDLENFSFPLQNVLRLRIVGIKNSVNDWISITEVKWQNVVSAIDEIEASSIAIFPNPTSKITNISAPIRISEISVLNSLGQVSTESVNDFTTSIDLSNYENGLYFIKIKLENGQEELRKILKQ